MKRAYLSIIFWVILALSLAMMLSIFLSEYSSKTMNLLAKDISEKVQKQTTPIFEIKDTQYDSLAGMLSFTFINIGDPIVFHDDWKLDIKSVDGSLLCTTRLTSTGVYNSSLITFTPDKTRFVRGDTVSVDILVSPECKKVLDQLYNSRERAMAVLNIYPSAASDFIEYVVYT